MCLWESIALIRSSYFERHGHNECGSGMGKGGPILLAIDKGQGRDDGMLLEEKGLEWWREREMVE